jgi:glucose dehydrogenase
MFGTDAVHNLSAFDASEPYDVCIIGSGFAGAVLGRDLVSANVRTLMLESGGSLSRWLVDSRLRKLAVYEVSGDTDYPTTRTRARARGGTSNFWTGRSERFHPSDFANHPYAPPENPWPITYKELEPYYEKAEETLRVRGGALSNYMPPRKKELPVPAPVDISSLKSTLTKAGVTVDDSPTATPQKALRFFRLHKELLPGFLASPYGTLVSGVTVTRLLEDRDRRIVGVEARTLEGTTKTARAKLYVVACGGIETPRLLLLSRSYVSPNGIGNAYDRVGRGFNEHPSLNLYGQIPPSWGTIYPRHEVGRIHQFYDHLRREGLGSMVISAIQSWVFPHHLISPSQPLRDLLRVPGRALRPILYLGPTLEMRPRDGNRVILSKHAKDCFGNPVAHLIFNFSEEDRRTLDLTKKLILKIFKDLGIDKTREAQLNFSRHHIGTCRMGNDPKTSVTDRTLRVHDCPNLYLGGCETFVTGAAVPPVLTIVALAHRLADELLTGLRYGHWPFDNRRPKMALRT